MRDARLWYESEGSGEPLVLIAGGPGFSHDYFHPFFTPLSSSFRVIYFDAFGRGKSDHAKNPHEYSLDRDVEDIEGLRQALGLGKINLLGHSYGGFVAQAFALRYPDSLRRLILADTGFSGEMWQANNDNSAAEARNQFPEVWEKIEQVHRQGFDTCSHEYQDANKIPLSLLYMFDGSNASKITEASMNNDVYCAIAGPDADFIVSGDLGRLDFRGELKNIRVPLLIIVGRYDRVLSPKWSFQFRQYAPQGKFVVFEQSGHFPFVEETSKMLRVLREFLGEN